MDQSVPSVVTPGAAVTALPAPEIDAQLVHFLTELTEKVKAGAVTGIAMGIEHRDGSVQIAFSKCADRARLAAAMLAAALKRLGVVFTA